jgi:membrane fusion protein (multidrug efflux system)
MLAHQRLVIPPVVTRAMTRFVTTAALAFPLLAGTGCHSQATAEGKAQAAAVTEPTAIDTVVVEERPMPEYLLVTGTLLPNQESKVAAGVSGKVLSTQVERGTQVKKGTVLAVLDTRTVSANIAEARATAATARTQREQARTDCERSQDLYAKGAMPKAEFDRLQSQCLATQSQADAAEARARALSFNLGDAAIRSPFPGSVVERNISAGEYVQAQTVVATVAQLDPLRLELSVPESAVQEMRPGLVVEFRLAAQENEHFSGTVRYIGPSVRRTSRDLLVEAVVDNHDRRLLPGMFATARIHIGDPQRPVVPASAVRDEGSLHHLFVVHDGKLEERLVQLGEKKDGLVAILDGAKPGDQVARMPASLTDGQPVKAR